MGAIAILPFAMYKFESEKCFNNTASVHGT